MFTPASCLIFTHRVSTEYRITNLYAGRKICYVSAGMNFEVRTLRGERHNPASHTMQKLLDRESMPDLKYEIVYDWLKRL